MQKQQQITRKQSGGRPQLSDSERRCIRVQPSFTLVEFEALQAKASAAGLEVSEWLRTASLGLLVKSVPAINRSAYAELSKTVSNLNQLAFVANASSNIHVEALVQSLHDTRENVQLLRAALIGRSYQ